MKRFTEKPDAARAADFVKAGNYFWNSGMFLWSARTLANALLEHLSEDRSDAPADRGHFWNPQVCSDISPDLPQVRKHQYRLRGTRAAFRPAENKIGTLSVFLLISDGTIWARGPRCTNTTPPKAIRKTAIW